MECQLQMCEMVQKLVNTSLFSFQDLKLSTRDIIVVLKDTLNTTSWKDTQLAHVLHMAFII
jgi:hypothetical protein